MTKSDPRAGVVFGGKGVLGSAIVEALENDGLTVWTVGRSPDNSRRHLVLQELDAGGLRPLAELPLLDVAVWAQGINADDSIDELDHGTFHAVIDANLQYVVSTMSELLNLDRLADPARLCVLSSIWQESVRTQKFSYAVSKSALAGLVRSAATDLASRNILVNAVLPSVVDSAMTRQVLGQDQIDKVAAATGFGRLITAADVASAVRFLCSTENHSITGQFLRVDLGFTDARQL